LAGVFDLGSLDLVARGLLELDMLPTPTMLPVSDPDSGMLASTRSIDSFNGSRAAVTKSLKSASRSPCSTALEPVLTSLGRALFFALVSSFSREVWTRPESLSWR